MSISSVHVVASRRVLVRLSTLAPFYTTSPLDEEEAIALRSRTIFTVQLERGATAQRRALPRPSPPQSTGKQASPPAPPKHTSAALPAPLLRYDNDAQVYTKPSQTRHQPYLR